MRFRGLHHIELSVPDYDQSIRFYDRMFGWLGYKSFWTLNIGYKSTYYMARFPIPHSYIGIQPALTGGKLQHEARPSGIHHVALWARSKKEIDSFHQQFLLQEAAVKISDVPRDYPIYAPGYYAVFFDDPVGIHWELAFTPRVPSPKDILKTLRAAKEVDAEHPEWKSGFAKEMMRTLPGRRR